MDVGRLGADSGSRGVAYSANCRPGYAAGIGRAIIYRVGEQFLSPPGSQLSATPFFCVSRDGQQHYDTKEDGTHGKADSYAHCQTAVPSYGTTNNMITTSWDGAEVAHYVPNLTAVLYNTSRVVAFRCPALVAAVRLCAQPLQA